MERLLYVLAEVPEHGRKAEGNSMEDYAHEAGQTQGGRWVVTVPPRLLRVARPDKGCSLPTQSVQPCAQPAVISLP